MQVSPARPRPSRPSGSPGRQPRHRRHMPQSWCCANPCTSRFIKCIWKRQIGDRASMYLALLQKIRAASRTVASILRGAQLATACTIGIFIVSKKPVFRAKGDKHLAFFLMPCLPSQSLVFRRGVPAGVGYTYFSTVVEYCSRICR